MPYLVCVTNIYRHSDPSEFTADWERAYARETMHFLLDTLADAERECQHWANHTCCDWQPSLPVAVDGEPALCPLCGERLVWEQGGGDR
jgi:hypothetical protein